MLMTRSFQTHQNCVKKISHWHNLFPESSLAAATACFSQRYAYSCSQRRILLYMGKVPELNSAVCPPGLITKFVVYTGGRGGIWSWSRQRSQSIISMLFRFCRSNDVIFGQNLTSCAPRYVRIQPGCAQESFFTPDIRISYGICVQHMVSCHVILSCFSITRHCFA